MAGSEHQGWLRWRRRVAELIVIALGVFLGLGADAAWDARQDAARELDYLRQLHIDLLSKEVALQGAIVEQGRIRRAADLALEGINSDVLPEADSLAGWIWRAGFTSIFEPSLATVTSLIQTGDLRLISGERFRGDLIRYEQATVRFRNSAVLYDEFRLRSLEGLGSVLSLDALPAPYGSPDPRIPPDWDVISANAAFHSAVFGLVLASKVRTDFLLEFQRRVDELREGLDQEFAAHGIEPAAS